MAREVLPGCVGADKAAYLVFGRGDPTQGWRHRSARRIRGPSLFHTLVPHSPDARTQNILPYFPVLKEVYLGVQRTLFPQPMRIIEHDERR